MYNSGPGGLYQQTWFLLESAVENLLRQVTRQDIVFATEPAVFLVRTTRECKLGTKSLLLSTGSVAPLPVILLFTLVSDCFIAADWPVL